MMSLLLVSCQSFRTYESRPLDPEWSAANFSGRKLASKSMSVEELADVAWKNNGDLKVARAKFDEARAAIGTASQRLNPTLTAGPTLNLPKVAALSLWMHAFNLDIPIETAGKRPARIEKSRQAAETARLEAVNAAWTIRTEVRKSALDFEAARRRAEFIDTQIKVQREMMGLLERRVASGESARTELTAVRLLANQTELLLGDANRQQEVARASLASAVGMPVLALEGIELRWKDFESPSDPGSVKSTALLHRADILAAVSDYAVAEASLKLEIARQYPDFHINPLGYQWDQGVHKWSLGWTGELPVMNHNQGPVAEAEAARASTAARFEALQARVIGDLEKAEASWKGSKAKVAAADRLVAGQEDAVRRAADLVKAGESDQLEVLSAEIELAAARQGRLEALIETQSALGELEAIIQQPVKP